MPRDAGQDFRDFNSLADPPMTDPATSGLILWAGAYGAGVNLVTFAVFGLDKLCARRRFRRVPERRLLMLAAVGGSFGAVAAQRSFRHKTHKQPFGNRLRAIVIGQIVLVSALCVVLIGVRAGWISLPVGAGGSGRVWG